MLKVFYVVILQQKLVLFQWHFQGTVGLCHKCKIQFELAVISTAGGDKPFPQLYANVSEVLSAEASYGWTVSHLLLSSLLAQILLPMSA